MSAWKVLPHGDLVQVGPDVWQVSGTMDLPIPRNMAVVRLPDGGLVLHSVVAMDEARQAELEALGPIAAMIAPSFYHRLDIAQYKARYPKAAVIAPARVRSKVEEVVKVDATCEDFLPGLGIGCRAVGGLAEMQYDVPGGTVIVCDALGHGATNPGFGGWVASFLGPPGAKLGIPRIVKWRQCEDYEAFKRWLGDLAAREDVTRLMMAHGDVVSQDVRAELKNAAARL
jgi:hypothetical protein